MMIFVAGGGGLGEIKTNQVGIKDYLTYNLQVIQISRSLSVIPPSHDFHVFMVSVAWVFLVAKDRPHRQGVEPGVGFWGGMVQAP